MLPSPGENEQSMCAASSMVGTRTNSGVTEPGRGIWSGATLNQTTPSRALYVIVNSDSELSHCCDWQSRRLESLRSLAAEPLVLTNVSSISLGRHVHIYLTSSIRIRTRSIRSKFRVLADTTSLPSSRVVVMNEKGAVDIDGAFAWVGKYGTKRLEI